MNAFRQCVHVSFSRTRGTFNFSPKYILFYISREQTTAHTLALAFGLLALYPEEQERAFQEVKSVLSDGRLPASHRSLEISF